MPKMRSCLQDVDADADHRHAAGVVVYLVNSLDADTHDIGLGHDLNVAALPYHHNSTSGMTDNAYFEPHPMIVAAAALKDCSLKNGKDDLSHGAYSNAEHIG